MKVVVTKDEFQEKLSDIKGIVEAKQGMAILGHFLLTAKKGASVIQATNLETYLREPIALTVEEEGVVALPGRKMLEIIKEVEGDISLESDGESWVKVKAGSSKFRIASLGGSEFPAFPGVQGKGKLSIEARTLSVMIEKTVFATGQEDRKYVMNGILFHLKAADKALVLVGTNGHRLSISGRAVTSTSKEELQAIVPRKNISDLKRFLDVDGTMSVVFGKDHVVFTIGQVEFLQRLLEGTYPNYMQIVPKNEKKLLIEREGFLKAVRRVSIMANGNNAIKLEFAKTAITINAAASDLGEAKDEVPVDYKGDAVTLGLNSAYLLDALSVMGGERMQLELGGALEPLALRDGADDGYLYIVMPIRL